MFSKTIADKRRWRRYKARTRRLPAGYRTAIDAVERYLMHLSGRGDGPDWASMLEDLADLFEQAAADRTPIRDVVGDDPVEFVDTFMQNYPAGSWHRRERGRLTSAIDRAVELQRSDEGGSR